MQSKLNLIKGINQKIADHSMKTDIFALLAVIMNCIFITLYVYEYQLGPTSTIINIGALIVMLCLTGMAIYFLHRRAHKSYFPIIWFCAVFLGLSFFSIYSVFATGGKKYLVLNLSSSLLLLAMVVDSWMFIIISIFGLSLAYLAFLITNPQMQIFSSSKKLYLISYLVSYTFIAISLFMRRKEKMQAKNMDFMKVFGGAIAHEVRAPLASIKMMSGVLNSIIETMSVKNNEEEFSIMLDRMDYEMLTDTINKGLKKASNDASQIIEMLLSALRERYTNNKEACAVGLIVRDAASMASHLDPDGTRIAVEIEEDFEIVCSRQLIKHAVYNLIKNSLKHGGSEVRVKVRILKKQIVVKDNGVGIPKAKIDTLFKAFETNGNGTGIGLAFCKFVLDDIDSKITCESIVGKYTKFTMVFENTP